MGGRPKALLPLGDHTFLETVLARLDEAGVDERRVVVGLHGPQIRAAVSLPAEAWVQNPDPDAEMLASLRLGLRALPLQRLDYVILWPVDHPHVSAETVTRLVETAGETGAPVVLPVHDGRRGHPVLFSARVLPELDAVPPGQGARAVVHAHSDELAEVAVDDPGVLRDVNTPEDLDDRAGAG